MSEILVETIGPITQITLNRPGEGNAVTNEMAVRLGEAITAACDSHFIVLRGAGPDFCTGRAGMGNAPVRQLTAYERRSENDMIFGCGQAFRRSPVPVIGLVQGRAIGFGCVLSTLCDITLASEAATFRLPEMGHRIMPTIAMSSLADRVPRKALTYLIYSTKEIDAHRAQDLGIVSDVFPEDQLESGFSELRKDLEAAPRPAILGVKEYARLAYSMSVESAVDLARNMHVTVNSADGMRG